MLDEELFIVDRKQRRELKRLEDELPQWLVIVDDLIGTGTLEHFFSW